MDKNKEKDKGLDKDQEKEKVKIMDKDKVQVKNKDKEKDNHCTKYPWIQSIRDPVFFKWDRGILEKYGVYKIREPTYSNTGNTGTLYNYTYVNRKQMWDE